MQVRQVLAAALLAATAVGAMAQEIDRSETLQARSLASQQERAAGLTGRSVESVTAETRNLAAQGALRIGEKADAPVVDAVPVTALAQAKNRAQVKSELAQWRASHAVVTGERG